MREVIKREGKEVVKREKSLAEQQREVLEKIKAKSLPVISEILEGREFVVLDCDNSGSMEGEKLKKLKEAILEFILAKERIDPRDRTALVTFGGNPQKWFDFTNDRNLTKKKVSELEAGGETPMGEGFSLCQAMFTELRKKKMIGQPKIILLSDGQANGPGDPQRSIDEARALKELRVIIDAIGFGEGKKLDEELLKEIAKITGGKYIHVRDISQLPKTYVKLAEKKLLPSQTKLFLEKGK